MWLKRLLAIVIGFVLGLLFVLLIVEGPELIGQWLRRQ